MIVNISNHKSTVIEHGVYYFAPPDFPHITASELKTLLTFIEYEKSYGRQTEIICHDENLLNKVNNAIAHPETVADTLFVPAGTVQWGRIIAGTRSIHAFGGKRIKTE